MATAEDREQQLLNELVEFSSEYPRRALSLLAGLLVGLLEHHVDEGGGDPKLEIKIDGEGKRRDITISAQPDSKYPKTEVETNTTVGPELKPGSLVVYMGATYEAVAYGDMPGTFDIVLYPDCMAGDRFRNVPASALKLTSKSGE